MRSDIFVTSIVIAISTAASGGPPQGVAVPAFFRLYNANGTVNPDWVRIQQAGPTVKIVVAGIDIGDTAGQGNVCTSSPAAMFDCLRANNTLVLGYVDTSNTRRLQAYVLRGGDGFASVAAWYNMYGGHLDGIFFDQGPSVDVPIREADQQTYYQALYQAVTNPNSQNYHPGPCGGHACVMLNASQFYNSWVMSVTDYATLYERPVHGSSSALCPPNYRADPQDYFDTRWFCPGSDNTSFCVLPYQNPPGWYFTPNTAANVAHILFSASSQEIDAIIAMSRSSYGSPAFLYLHHQNCGVYGQLSNFFEQLVTALSH